MEQLLYYNLTPTRSFLHSETWKDPFCLSICYLKKLLCGHQLDSGLSFFSQRSCMIAFLPLSRYHLDQLAGGGRLARSGGLGGIKRERERHTPLVFCSSALQQEFMLVHLEKQSTCSFSPVPPRICRSFHCWPSSSQLSPQEYISCSSADQFSQSLHLTPILASLSHPHPPTHH